MVRIALEQICQVKLLRRASRAHCNGKSDVRQPFFQMDEGKHRQTPANLEKSHFVVQEEVRFRLPPAVVSGASEIFGRR
jgi:hypothetical protein